MTPFDMDCLSKLLKELLDYSAKPLKGDHWLIMDNVEALEGRPGIVNVVLISEDWKNNNGWIMGQRVGVSYSKLQTNFKLHRIPLTIVPT